MFPFWSSFIKRPELMINPKRVNISLQVIKVINLLRYRTLFKYSDEPKTCGLSYFFQLESGNDIDC